MTNPAFIFANNNNLNRPMIERRIPTNYSIIDDAVCKVLDSDDEESITLRSQLIKSTEIKVQSRMKSTPITVQSTKEIIDSTSMIVPDTPNIDVRSPSQTMESITLQSRMESKPTSLLQSIPMQSQTDPHQQQLPSTKPRELLPPTSPSSISLLRQQDHHQPASRRNRSPIADRTLRNLPADIRRKLFQKTAPPTRRHSITAIDAYPMDLTPRDHPILIDQHQHHQSTVSKKCPRTKSPHQTLSRYNTLPPLAFEGISEADEELYLKNHAKDDDEDISSPDDPFDHRSNRSTSNDLTLRRTCSFGHPSSTNHHHHHHSKQFDDQSMTRPATKVRSYSAGSMVFSPQTSPKIGNRFVRQRSQDSLIQLGVSSLPTIPEELRQQQQHNRNSKK